MSKPKVIFDFKKNITSTAAVYPHTFKWFGLFKEEDSRVIDEDFRVIDGDFDCFIAPKQINDNGLSILAMPFSKVTSVPTHFDIISSKLFLQKRTLSGYEEFLAALKEKLKQTPKLDLYSEVLCGD